MLPAHDIAGLALLALLIAILAGCAWLACELRRSDRIERDDQP
jgi:hypothetical protein